MSADAVGNFVVAWNSFGSSGSDTSGYSIQGQRYALALAVADLSITKDDGVTSAIPGGFLTYTIVVSNAGPDDDPAVTLTDSFPADLTCSWTSAAAGGATGHTAAGSGNLSETLAMPAGSSVTYTATCAIDPGATGTLSNTATVAASVIDPAAANNSATDADTVLAPQADLSVTKSATPDPVTPGDNLTYTLNVDNAGPATATAVTVTDALPPGVSFVHAGGTGWTCGDMAGLLTCTRPTLAPGAAPPIILVVSVHAVGTTLINTAVVSAASADPEASNDNSSVVTTVLSVMTIPTLGPLALVLLIAALAAAALARLKPKPF